ncbi:AAA family ATPase [Streptomyces coelicoflavus]|uniref:AAA family ATPase n=1 Tax=Streptomyces TaxID=1883 RepID=UPI000B411543|nr:AAA family ATPase [Streptomyces sp. CS159]OWA07879.1 AAA family ATPase [Streptomyces sp. CS159]
MTAPWTPPPPPNERSSYQGGPVPPPVGAHAVGADAVGTAPGGPYDHHGDPHGEQDGPGMLKEVRQAAVTVVAVAVFGALLGVLWWKLAPSVPLVGDVADGGWVVYLKDSEGEQAIGVDGTFTLLALAFGALSAVVVFLLRRRGGVPLVVALGVGGLLGSLLAWWLGVQLGPAQDVIAHAKEVGEGVTFSAPLKLGAKGVLLAWSFAALVVHLGLTGLFGPRDPEPDPWPAPGQYPPGAYGGK